MKIGYYQSHLLDGISDSYQQMSIRLEVNVRCEVVGIMVKERFQSSEFAPAVGV